MIWGRSRLGFFFLGKVMTRVVTYRQRRVLDMDQHSHLIASGASLAAFLPLPLLARRRLYSRLLVVGSGSAAGSLGRYVSSYLRHRFRAKQAQLYFRHAEVIGYVSLQVSNQFILVRQTLSLAVLGRLRLSAWLVRLGAAVRFVFSSLTWVAQTRNIARIRGFLFFLWTLS